MYNDLYSCILVDNFIFNPVKITRNRKQRCSLSPSLYVLCLEQITRKVVNDKDDVSIKLPGTCDNCKISVFADYSTGI